MLCLSIFQEREQVTMVNLGKAIHEMHSLENLAERDILICRIHPLSKLLVTVWYLALLMSFGKHDVSGLLGMCLYPLVLMILGDISIGQAFYRLRPLFLLVFFIGAANPVFDRTPYFMIGKFTITTGMLSMATLFCKTALAVLASYILIALTTMEQICYALRKLHVPKVLVTVLLLIYRYLILMMKEADRLTQAYSLRTMGEKGIRKSAWGSLAGGMLLRSLDRAQMVYESMTLRGFQGEFFLRGSVAPLWQGVCYGFIWGVSLAILRLFPVFQMVGKIIMEID